MNQARFGLVGFVVLALAALLNFAALYATESSFRELRDTGAWVRQTVVARGLIEHLYRLVVDAETGQRGYLLAQDDSFLEPYRAARDQIHGTLKKLRDLIAEDPVQAARIDSTSRLLDQRLAQLQESLDLQRTQGDDALRAFLLAHEGQKTMQSLRSQLDDLAAKQQLDNDHRYEVLARLRERIRRLIFVEVGLNLLLVVAGAIFLAHDARRRRREITMVSESNARLTQAVQQRTADLTQLSHYLQRVQEDEKAKIAREIHDDLGGTLAAAKIDLQLLSDRLPGDDPHQTRIARIMAAIDDAVQVKRRIIEDLRPTILDNLGIGPALRWQCAEFANRHGRNCRAELEDEDLRLSPEYSIMFFRVVQEALTNVGKHADAKTVTVSLRADAGRWVLRIMDDGVGFDAASHQNPLAHGLLSMRERVRALGGRFAIQSIRGRGTVIEVEVPVENSAPITN